MSLALSIVYNSPKYPRATRFSQTCALHAIAFIRKAFMHRLQYSCSHAIVFNPRAAGNLEQGSGRAGVREFVREREGEEESPIARESCVRSAKGLSHKGRGEGPSRPSSPILDDMQVGVTQPSQECTGQAIRRHAAPPVTRNE